MAESVTPPRQANWEDVERAALFDPVLHHLVSHARRIGKRDALIATVLWLAKDRKELMDREVERRNASPLWTIPMPGEYR